MPIRRRAEELGIELLFLPADSPNRNLIERLWRFTTRNAISGKYHPSYQDFRAAVQGDWMGSKPHTRTDWHP